MKVKDDLHHLIDTIEDEQILKSYYQLIQNLTAFESGLLWTKLSEIEKQELILSYDESSNKVNLISHNDVKAQHSRWLKP